MSTTTKEAVMPMSSIEFEKTIRRIVQEVVHDVVHQELTRLVRFTAPDQLDWFVHEGSEDPEGDEELLQEALTVLEEYGDKPESWISLEQLEAKWARTKTK